MCPLFEWFRNLSVRYLDPTHCMLFTKLRVVRVVSPEKSLGLRRRILSPLILTSLMLDAFCKSFSGKFVKDFSKMCNTSNDGKGDRTSCKTNHCKIEN